MPTLGSHLDFAKLEARNLRGHQLGSNPGSPVTGQVYYNTGDNTMYFYDNSTWVSMRGGASATPPATNSALGTVQLAGDLAGNNTATAPALTNLCVTDAKVAVANKDGAAGTYSMRTLGTGAAQACAGNDARLSDSRAPSGTASGDLSGTYPSPQIATGVIVDTDVNSANKDGFANVPSMRTIGTGALQSMAGNTRLDTIAAPTGSVNLNNQIITGLATPVGTTDAVTKAYVDNIAQGIDAKASVLCATTVNITLTNAQTIDGIAVVTGDRVLVKNQTLPANNGIYVVASGGAWTRALDADTWNEHVSAYVFVETGSTQADTGWVCLADAGGVLGTNNLAWTQFSGAGSYIAGNGLTLTGNSFDVGPTAGRISVSANAVDIDSGYVGQSSITTLGSISTGTWSSSATPIGVSSGGTGQITSKAARETGLAAAGYYSATGPASSSATISIPASTHLLRSNRGLIVQCAVVATGDQILPDVNVSVGGDVTITFAAAQGTNSIQTTIIG